jgi:hypothetical protein
MVIVLATVPKVCRFMIFKGDKVRSMNSFGREVKPSAPCLKILRHVKYPSSYNEKTDGKYSAAILRPVSPRFTTRCLLEPEQGTLVNECVMVRTQMASTIDQKISAVAWDAMYDTTP